MYIHTYIHTNIHTYIHTYILYYNKLYVCSQEVQLNPGEKSAVTVRYDSTYCVDRHTRIEENPLAVAYKEHPHRVSHQPGRQL